MDTLQGGPDLPNDLGKAPSIEDQTQIARGMSFGEKAVGLSFNPGGNPKVESIKRKFAEIIDELNGYKSQPNQETHPEVARMLSIAITECQTAQMWAVKAVTWQF